MCHHIVIEIIHKKNLVRKFLNVKVEISIFIPQGKYLLEIDFVEIEIKQSNLLK